MRNSDKSSGRFLGLASVLVGLGILAGSVFSVALVQRARADDATLNAALVDLDAGNSCEGVGYIVLAKNGKPVKWVLRCRGQCVDADGQLQPCTIQSSQNDHGGIREWCGCGPDEPPTCHLVKITPGRGEGGGRPYFVCAGQCPPAPGTSEQLYCLPVEETIVVAGRTVIRVHCECFPQDLFEPAE